ncbi:MAG TPA: methyltransferase domain-containing protein [Phenylobacterium sp.]
MAQELTYNPDVFRVPDEDAAKRIILTPERGMDTDERWSRETPYLGELLAKHLPVPPGGLIVDFGCGIGRLAREMIVRLQRPVLGVDISQDMRRLAPPYVDSEGFSIASAELFKRMVLSGLRVDAALSVWVIEHCLRPADDLDLLALALKPGGRLAIVNGKGRAVPTKERPWVSDGVDVRKLLAERFDVVEEGALDPAVIGGEEMSQATFWGVYAKRPSA